MPEKRYTKSLTKEQRRQFDENVKGKGVFAQAVIHCMIPHVEEYFRKGMVELVQMSSEGVVLFLKDASLVKAL